MVRRRANEQPTREIMYEAHFGFSGTPFSLNPDPAFYFESKGHGHALSYLRYGVYQSEGFVVVTGEVGAGKTTLVRTLLSELDENKIVAAQIVSTQLEAGDLLRSVAIAFGITPKSASKAELIASIEAFLTVLVTQEKRALLIVDEAQNLNPQAVEELRMLSNFQLGSCAMLQSFLVGQPELRQLLTSKPMEQFRQRVIASCHLGGMNAEETRAYVEHRLRKVGWNGAAPAFEPAAFERIHHWSGGIPRRVNLLCNRLLLAAYLRSADTVVPADVDAVAAEVSAEVGEARSRGAPLVEIANTEPLPAPMHASAPAAKPALRLAPRASENGARSTGPLLCVATDPADEAMLATFMVELQERAHAPALVLVRAGEPAQFFGADDFLGAIGIDVPMVEVELDEALTPAARMAETMRAFEPLVDLHRPSAILLASASNVALACALVADACGVPVIRAEAGAQDHDGPLGDSNERVLSCLAMALSTDARPAVGNESLLADAMALAASEAVDAPPAASAAPAFLALVRERGFAVVVMEQAAVAGERIAETLGALREASTTLPLLLCVPAVVARRLEPFGLKSLLKGGRMATAGPQNYAQFVAVMRGASGVVTDVPRVRQEAELLGLPCAGPAEAATAARNWAKDRPVRTPQPTGASSRLATLVLDWWAAGQAAPTTRRQSGT